MNFSKKVLYYICKPINNIIMTSKERYFNERPLVEMYKGYEIRKYKAMFIVDAAIAIYGTLTTHIKDCYEFIDNLVNLGIKQYDNEAVSKYVFSKR